MEEALKREFGISFTVRKCNAPSGLPFYMTDGRDFYVCASDELQFLMITISEQSRFGAVALEKQLSRYMKASGMNTAYQFTSLNKVQRDALVSRNIPFICMPDQMYLPFLGIILSNRFRVKRESSAEAMTPASQSLFLYLLYRKKSESVIKKQAAMDLGLTQTSITRASRQLQAMELLQEETRGKEIRMRASAEGRAYYQKAYPCLINPVLRILTVEEKAWMSELPLAGETALSEETMLGSPSIPVMAAFRNDPRIKNLEELDQQWVSNRKLVHIEVWKYDPSLFSVNLHVDPVSLSVSLRDINDERVEGELRDYMEGLKW